MVKFLSKIIGSRVLLYQERAIVGNVDRLLFSPKDAKVVGIAILPAHQKKLLYIPINEIKGFGEGFLLVEDIGSLSDEHEVLKIKEVLKNEPQIIGTRVVNENNDKIGIVDDVTVDLEHFLLAKLYVIPRFSFGPFGSQRIIDRKQIVKIERKKIIVRDDTRVKKSVMTVPAELPVAE